MASEPETGLEEKKNSKPSLTSRNSFNLFRNSDTSKLAGIFGSEPEPRTSSEPTKIPTDVGENSPVIRCADADAVKKGEDFRKMDTECRHKNIQFGSFYVFDGHNGASAALYAKRQLYNQVMQQLPEDAGSDPQKFLEALPKAMAEGFLVCHNTYSKRGEASGTTATMVVITGWTVTVAAVGDSRAVLGTREGGCESLTADHRLDSSLEERERISQEGGKIAPMKSLAGKQIGPLRSWPGGLCVSRSLGDIDCGRQIPPLPYVLQVEVPRSGGRIIIASDGLWDSMGFEKAMSLSRGLPSSKAASLLCKEAVKWKGLHDDVTVVVVDMLPSDTPKGDTSACPLTKPWDRNLWSKMTSSIRKDKGVKSVDDSLKTPKIIFKKDFMSPGPLQQKYREGNFSGRAAAEKIVCKGCGMQLAVQNLDPEKVSKTSFCFCPPPSQDKKNKKMEGKVETLTESLEKNGALLNPSPIIL